MLYIYYSKKNYNVNSFYKKVNNNYGDYMQDKEIFSLSLDIGKEIIRSGGEISRAKDTIIRINKAYGNSCEVFALPSVIIAQSGEHIQIRHIDNEDTDLAELARLNALSRRLCKSDNEEIHVTKKTIYHKAESIIAICTATGSFCIFFGGSIIDALFSAFIGIVITYCHIEKLNLPSFSVNLISAFISSLLANIPTVIGLSVNPDKIIIGTIMLLVPGLTVVNSIRDMMKGDLIAGLFELFNAIMSALAIALGVAGGIFITKWI